MGAGVQVRPGRDLRGNSLEMVPALEDESDIAQNGCESLVLPKRIVLEASSEWRSTDSQVVGILGHKLVGVLRVSGIVGSDVVNQDLVVCDVGLRQCKESAFVLRVSAQDRYLGVLARSKSCIGGSGKERIGVIWPGKVRSVAAKILELHVQRVASCLQLLCVQLAKTIKAIGTLTAPSTRSDRIVDFLGLGGVVAERRDHTAGTQDDSSEEAVGIAVVDDGMVKGGHCSGAETPKSYLLGVAAKLSNVL